MKMTKSNDKVLLAIKNSSYGRLKYDRHWEQEGRTRDIADDINERLCSITTSPREITHDSPHNGHSNYPLNGSVSSFPGNLDPCNSSSYESQIDHAEENLSSKKASSSSLTSTSQDDLKVSCESSVTKFLQEFQEMKRSSPPASRIPLKKPLSLTSIAVEIADLTDCLNSDSGLVESNDIDEKLNQVQQKSQQVKALKEALDRRKQLQQQYKVKIDQCVRQTLEKLNDFTRDSQDYKNFINNCRGKVVSQTQSITNLTRIPEPSDDDVERMKNSIESLETFCSSLIESAKKLAEKIDQETAAQNAELARLKEIEKEEKEKNLKLQEDAIIAKANACKPHSATISSKNSASDVNIKSTETVASSSEALFFERLIDLKKFEESIAPFIADNSTKSYRSDLTLFLKININNISTGSNDVIKSKFRLLCDLFDGKNVKYRNSTINCTRHEMALKFCYHTAVNTFLAAAPKQLIDVPQSAFSISAVITLLWCHHKQFGDLFFASLVKKCPYIVGFYPKKLPDDSEAGYLELCGYSLTNGKVESEECFLNRMKSFVKLYSAIVQSHPEIKHPQSLEYGWMFIARTLNIEPIEGISPAILYAFLSVCTYRMTVVYKKQFIKILRFIETDYIKRIESCTKSIDKKPALEQLRLLMKDIGEKITSHQLNELKPQGIMPNNFWSSSYLNSR